MRSILVSVLSACAALALGSQGALSHTQITTDPANDSYPAWSPEGTHIAFVSNRSGNDDIWVIRLSDGELTQITTHPDADTQPDWSPDGERIAFRSWRGGSSDIWVIRLSDGELTQVTNLPGGEYIPAWSPDGSRIAFWENVDICVVRLSDGAVTNITDYPSASDTHPTWSPDGSQLAFRSDRGGDTNIWRIRLSDGTLTQVTTSLDEEGGPHWSVNDEIAFFRYRDSNYDIWTVPATGGMERRMTASPADDRAAAWSPDGSQIAFRSDRDDGDGIDDWDIWTLSGTISVGASPPLVRSMILAPYPNPFNPTTTLPFTLGTAGSSRILVYDVNGRFLRRLVDDHLPAGEHSVTWDGRDATGSPMPSGVYVYVLSVDERVVGTRKAALLR